MYTKLKELNVPVVGRNLNRILKKETLFLAYVTQEFPKIILASSVQPLGHL